jgi:hypothetical protein
MAARQFEKWRGRRTTHRIPEELWVLAVELADCYGVNPTARALGVDYYTLKGRREGSSGKAPKEAKTSAGFVELLPTPLAPSTGCVVEFADPSGAAMKVQLPTGQLPDIVALGRLFLERRA